MGEKVKKPTNTVRIECKFLLQTFSTYLIEHDGYKLWIEKNLIIKVNSKSITITKAYFDRLMEQYSRQVCRLGLKQKQIKTEIRRKQIRRRKQFKLIQG